MDFDPKNKDNKEFTHSPSHFSFGMHRNCRVTMSSPLTSLEFILFVIQNFYNREFHNFKEFVQQNTFVETLNEELLTTEEQKKLHISTRLLNSN